MLGFKGKTTQNLTRIHIGPLEVNYVKIPSQESHVINPSYSAVCRGGSRIFSQGGSGGTQTHCHRDAAGVSGEGTEGGLGGPPPRKFGIWSALGAILSRPEAH